MCTYLGKYNADRRVRVQCAGGIREVLPGAANADFGSQWMAWLLDSTSTMKGWREEGMDAVHLDQADMMVVMDSAALSYPLMLELIRSIRWTDVLSIIGSFLLLSSIQIKGHNYSNPSHFDISINTSIIIAFVSFNPQQLRTGHHHTTCTILQISRRGALFWKGEFLGYSVK